MSGLRFIMTKTVLIGMNVPIGKGRRLMGCVFLGVSNGISFVTMSLSGSEEGCH